MGLLLLTLEALTPGWLDDVVKVFFAVVDSELLTSFDGALGEVVNMCIVMRNLSVAVWTTGVVYVASEVVAAFAVDYHLFTQGKEVFAPTTISLLV